MSYLLHSFLSTELTCIPQFMEKYIGKYYSNTAGNALTWVFVMWNVLHIVFDEYLDVLLKKMQFKTYVRKRLVRSIWYCGFYSASFLYCVATVLKNNIDILDYRRNLTLDGGPIPPHIVLGLGLFGTFFLHSSTWESFKYQLDLTCVGYFLLSFIPLFTYTSRRTELYLSLTGLLSIIQFIFHLLRCLSAVKMGSEQNLKGILYGNFLIFLILHVIAVPAFFVIPLIFSIIKYDVSISLIVLTVLLTTWWATEIFSGTMYRYIYHWVYHTVQTSEKVCCGVHLDCSLFTPRDDIAFNLKLIKQDIKEREEKLNSKKKPKSKGLLFQTLKCMVAIKRKLNNKRQSEKSDSSDSESEKEKIEKESSSEDESSSDENSEFDDDEKREAKEYREETARALKEDRECPPNHKDGNVIHQDEDGDENSD